MVALDSVDTNGHSCGDYEETLISRWFSLMLMMAKNNGVVLESQCWLFKPAFKSMTAVRCILNKMQRSADFFELLFHKVNCSQLLNNAINHM